MNSSDLRISIVSRLDADALPQLTDLLIAVVAEGASVGFLPPLARVDAQRYWSGVLGPDTVLLVAEREGRIVGTAQLHLASQANARHRAEVAKVLVDPGARRQGIGRALMQRIEEMARQAGRTLLILDTRAGDVSNGLYRSLGYVEVGEIPRYARSADGQLAATVIYYKELE
jgi:ribosomal protein S18 acetylase RimI-like enzyme